MPDDLVGAFIVTTDDEKMFFCSAQPHGADLEPRWVFHDTKGTEYMGPRVSVERTPDAVRGLVNEWWTLTKASSAFPERLE